MTTLDWAHLSRVKKFGACAQKRGLDPDIQDATNYLEHICKAVQADVPITRPIPIPLRSAIL